MKHRIFRRVIKYLFGAILVLYPLLVFSALVIFKLNIRYLSLLLIVLSIAYATINKHNYHGRHPAFIFISPAILFTIGCLCFALPFFIESTELNKLLLKTYPALANLVYLVIMLTSLFIPPNLVYTMVNLFDKDLKNHVDAGYFDRYCRKSAIIWCVFFFLDALVALATAFWASDLVWAIYNSGISYVIMGLIFAAQYTFIKVVENYIIRVIERKPEEVLEDKSE